MSAYGVSNVANIDSVQVLVVAGLLNENLQNECREDNCDSHTKTGSTNQSQLV